MPLGVLHSCPKHRGIQTPTAPSWKGTAQASACAGAQQDNSEHRKPNNLMPALFPLEKGCHTQTGKQGKRLNPHQLRCRYTNHDSSHMLADNGAPGPAPRSPEPDRRCSALTLGELRTTEGCQGPRRTGGRRERSFWGPSTRSRDLGPLSPTRRKAGSPLPGTPPGTRGRGLQYRGPEERTWGMPALQPEGVLCCGGGSGHTAQVEGISFGDSTSPSFSSPVRFRCP